MGRKKKYHKRIQLHLPNVAIYWLRRLARRNGITLSRAATMAIVKLSDTDVKKLLTVEDLFDIVSSQEDKNNEKK
jgi:hypothetical protein